MGGGGRQRHLRLQPQSVPGAQATGPDIELLSGVHQRIPDLLGKVGRADREAIKPFLYVHAKGGSVFYAVTDRAAVIVTMHVPVPVQAPLQPPKVWPLVATAGER